MHTTKEIGLIAGGGAIPALLVTAWLARGLNPVVVSLDDSQTQTLSAISGCIVVPCSVGQAGKMVATFHRHNVRDIVMIGTIRRPNFWTLRTDALGLKIILQIVFKHMGDNRLLTFIRKQLESHGFVIHAAQEYLPDILCPEGNLSREFPSAEESQAIARAVQAAMDHGRADKGQAAVMCDGNAVGFEDEKGTNALIAHHATIKGRKILVKMAKPQQDMALDAPTIGLHTIENLHQAGFAGIVIEAGRTIVVDRDDVIGLCDLYGIFLVGWKGQAAA